MDIDHGFPPGYDGIAVLDLLLVIVRPSRDGATLALRILHELAHVILQRLGWRHSHGDVWLLALAMAAPSSMIRAHRPMTPWHSPGSLAPAWAAWQRGWSCADRLRRRAYREKHIRPPCVLYPWMHNGHRRRHPPRRRGRPTMRLAPTFSTSFRRSAAPRPSPGARGATTPTGGTLPPSTTSPWRCPALRDGDLLCDGCRDAPDEDVAPGGPRRRARG